MNHFAAKTLLTLFPALVPFAVRWVESIEEEILASGTALGDEGVKMVRELGVAHPEKIRFLKVDSVPLPNNPILRAAARATGLISPHTVGMAFRYGIVIRSDWWESGNVQMHECVHTAQYERLGGVKPFLREYLRQCFEVGYPEAALEQEAILKSGWPS